MASRGRPQRNTQYGTDARHFDYVNPDAPKGGTVRLAASGGFDTFNILAQKGNIAPGILNIYESLMEPSLDEEDISANTVSWPKRSAFPTTIPGSNIAQSGCKVA